MASSYASKLALFRARFACRADAWARRWTSRGTGRSGFSPACGNEWRPGFCLKPSKRCSACRHRAWLPLTDEIVRWHLLGATPSGRPFALGGYPILIGDDARVAALQVPATAHPRGSPDLRREIQNAGEMAEQGPLRSLREIQNAGEMAEQGPLRSLREIQNAGEMAEQGPLRSLREIQNAAAAMGISPTITSAVDGNGFVLWWFFSAPVPAGLARSLVSACLTAARRAGAPVPFSAWDGILPEQATLPVTGPGVPVPLPLQGETRRRGLGVPLDPVTLAPAPDPWVALSAAPVLDPPRVERIVESSRGRLYPVASVDREQCIMRDAPAGTESPTRHPSLVTRHSRVSGTLSDRLRIPLAELPPGAAAALEETAAFLSPVFEDAERTRRPVRGIPRIESHARIEAMPDLDEDRERLPERPGVRSRIKVGDDLEDREAYMAFKVAMSFEHSPPGELLPESTTPQNALSYFERTILGRTITMPDGETIALSIGHFFRLVCDGSNGKKGYVAGYNSSQEALDAIRCGDVPAEGINGFHSDRARMLPVFIDAVEHPAFILQLKSDFNRTQFVKRYAVDGGRGVVVAFRFIKDGNKIQSFHGFSTRYGKAKQYRIAHVGDAVERGASPDAPEREELPQAKSSQSHFGSEVKRESLSIATSASAAAEKEPCLSLPRGCIEAARAALWRMGAELRVRDAREEGEALKVAFQGELRPEQKAAAEAMMRHEAGVLEAGTAFGKTVLAIVLTIGAMLIMLFLLVLLMSLIQQIFIFISTVYTELSYRARV